MTTTDHDPLIASLRAADPAASLPDVPPDRAAVRRALRRRRGPRWQVPALAVPALAAVAAGAFVLAPSGGPGLAQIVERAAAATAPPSHTIIAVRSRIEGRFWNAEDGRTSLATETTGWVRVAADGKPTDVRSLQTSSRNDPDSVGAESTTSYARPGAVAGAVSRNYDPKTGRTTQEQDSAEVPRMVFDAHRLLERARRGTTTVRLDGEATVDGHRTYRLVIEDPDPEIAAAGIVDRTELYVDTTTFAAVQYRTTSEGRTSPGGVPFRSELSERVLDWRALPDTPANRKLLQLRGPVTPAG